MTIEFSCTQCQHLQEADESQIGHQVFCRVCYFKLTVPAESTNKSTDESQLYSIDTQPWDKQNKQKLISLHCNICGTNIGVRKEQVGEEIICPECSTKIVVPKSIAEIAEARLKDELNKAVASVTHKEIYALWDGIAVPAEEWSKQIRFPCRLCGTALFATEKQVGTLVTCPDCETKTKVPQRTIKTETSPLPSLEFEGDTAFDLVSASKSETEKPSSVSLNENLVPVVCRLCGTRMYAKESQIGQVKTCPDCGQQTEIKDVPQHLKTMPETTSADAYEISKTDNPASRPVFRTLTDYRHVEGSLDQERHAERRDQKKHSRRSSHRSLNRLQLPKRPLTERFFIPFGYYELWLRLSPFVAIVPLGVMAICWAASATEEGGKVGTYGFAIFSMFLGLAIFLMFVATFCYFATLLLHFYSMTASGMDSGEFEGEIAPSDYFINGLWLFMFALVAAVPGSLLGKFLFLSPEVTYVMMRVSHWFFFPIFFLSSMEEGSMFAVLAKNTVCSLYRQSFAWFRFYLLTAILFLSSDLCLFAVNSIVALLFVSLILLFLLIAIQSLFFFRLLGRLAWLIEETDRQRREVEYEIEAES